LVSILEMSLQSTRLSRHQTSQIVHLSQSVTNSLLVLEHVKQLIREMSVDVCREETRVDSISSDAVRLAQ
ncbi:hypothetical protein KCU74_g142, partial [Aureobasidium melanogenum]